MDSLFCFKSSKPFAKDAAYLFSNEVGRFVQTANEKDYGGSVLSDGCAGAGWPYFEKYDYLISYISPWVIHKRLLDIVQIAAINFHPGPPEYPGIGCTNFALYDGAGSFGITVHHMLPKVDTGKIIMVKRFPIAENETVWTLSQKCYAYIFAAFCEMLPLFKSGWDFPRYKDEEVETWTREPYTRKQLDELCVITEDMSDEEVARRVRATTFPGMSGAFIEKGGRKFHVVS
jgi:methionyl-tRNA formyltransferase